MARDNKPATRALQIGYLFVPVAVLALYEMRRGHMAAFVLLVPILLAMQVPNRYLLGFVAWLVGWQLYLKLYLVGHQNSLDAMLSVKLATPYLTWVIWALAIFVVARRMDPRRFYNVICIAAIFQAFIGVLQAFGIYPLFALLDWLGVWVVIRHEMSPMVFGTLQNPNFLAMYLAISMPFFIRAKWWIFILPLLGLLAYLQTSTAIVALAAGGVFWSYRHLANIRLRVKIFTAGWAGLIVATYILIADGRIAQDPRWTWWWLAVKDICSTIQHFVAGHGPGYYVNFDWVKLHNDWLQIWWELGLIGVLFLAGFFGSLFRSRNPRHTTALLIAGICMLGNYPTRLAPTGLLIILVAAFCQGDCEPRVEAW